MSSYEQSAAVWMRAHGFPDATIQDPMTDIGIDVLSVTAVAQVRSGIAPATLEDIARFLTISSPMTGKRRIVFSRAGFAPDAVAHADAQGVALFISRDDSHMVPVNAAAQGMLLSASTMMLAPRNVDCPRRASFWSRPGVWYVIMAMLAGAGAMGLLDPQTGAQSNPDGEPDSLGVRVVVAGVLFALAYLSWRRAKRMERRRK